MRTVDDRVEGRFEKWTRDGDSLKGLASIPYDQVYHRHHHCLPFQLRNLREKEKWVYLRGHGANLKRCGQRKRKLNIWGMKKRSSVLLKCPKMSRTANVIPAK